MHHNSAPLLLLREVAQKGVTCAENVQNVFLPITAISCSARFSAVTDEARAMRSVSHHGEKNPHAVSVALRVYAADFGRSTLKLERFCDRSRGEMGRRSGSESRLRRAGSRQCGSCR